MKAEPSAQLTLLDLQAVDSQVAQLQHQLAHPVEAAELAELGRRRAETDGWVRDQQIVVDDLSAAQTKADADVEQVKARRKRDQDRIDSGQVANPKDIERMQHELATLERRISVLEDEEIEVMEQLETAQAGLEQMRSDLAEIDRRAAELTSALDERAGELRQRLDEVASGRDPLVAGVPDDLLALYERIRASRGSGAALLRARRCEGCMLTLDPAAISAIRGKAEDDVVRCEECTRILVRTAESGL
ncbi:MAG: C4-type zinc ribbon domain-containing protein [Nocardioidaceae bacterium]|nr:C4-type zinc ribbon domain-containing protein [Nocardioidaceae bacterium]MCL2611828.1 C4-type zinc ribbon domain-containing protein [Nocardioidaceae bacterium]